MINTNKFTFIVLTYNHENYIIEHLESIKYLIDTHGSELNIQIIIADDSSRDKTLEISKIWLKKNSNLFERIIILTDEINKGTCKNFFHGVEYLTTEYCKITAGDDVYSFENIFIEIKKIDRNHILSGLPLHLIDGVISSTKFDLFNLFGTNLIYTKNSYITRLKRISFLNSPNVVYSTSALKNKDVKEFVEKFKVTEDFPLQIKMAEMLTPLKFIQIEKIFVYYRRTKNSTYIIKNIQFNQDKLDIYNYLIKSEKNVIERFILINRRQCFFINNRFLKRVLNISFYRYGLNILVKFPKILSKLKNFNTQNEKHQSHYDLIVANAIKFKTN